MGAYAVEATCANCTSGSPQTFTAEAVTVTLKKETGDNQSGQMKKELKEPFVVKVTDATGAGVGGVYVSFSVAQKPVGSTGSYPSPSYTYTNADGTASSTLILGDKTGDYKVNAYCYAASGGSPQTFTAKAEDISYTLTKASGDEQKGYIEKALKEPFVVKVTDKDGKPMANVKIQWSISWVPTDTKGASISSATTATAADGMASATLTFGDTPGAYTVRATCDQCGDSSPQTFTAEALGIKLGLNLSRTQVYPFETSGDATTTIEATAQYTDGTPVDDGYPLKLKARSIDFSGGHQHLGQRPAGDFSGGGNWMYSAASSQTAPEIIATPTGGKFSISYRASRFGGIDYITANSNKNQNVTESSMELTVKVPGLGPLGTNTYWRLTGSSGRTSTRKCAGAELRHSENHMATFSTAIKVALLAKEHYEETGKILVINDMSVPLGGLFDICSDWQTPHKTHREGKNVDVDDQTSDGQLIDDAWLEDMVVNELGGAFLNEKTHFHLTF